ncbi:hypothetical protein BTM25_09860 [Actinomadura rubteroloni]|uniref:Mycothiol-dependent maleylpyruvate isomerase metal-binding domain-containing protein n=1 Tax=Actinomadura rubteroloni TaxID=1926885 RepID=A0A2P4UNG9_9ACTN|nr:TIGR03086 family metal-binding protein [Actinomadura rubteroloni]POM26585.1 hypothetical protein BTM25_09860 [Actinomadura rubteroloni]
MTLDTAAARAATLLAEVPDALLTAPTPCAGLSVAGLIEHFDTLALRLTATAGKRPRPDPSGTGLRSDWRGGVPARLKILAEAWADPAAWEGVTSLAGREVPAAFAGTHTLNELVLHGWDLARAVRLPYTADAADVTACIGLLESLPDEFRALGVFGAPVPVPPDAPGLDRLVALSGRDPSWTPPA